MTTAALKFGSLNLKLEPPSFGILDPGEPHIAVLAEGTDPGNPEAIVAAIASMLMDGDKAEVTRSGNQIARYPIEISGDDLDVVAAGEAMLMAEVNRGRNTTTWTPPGPAEPNVHDVVYSTLEFHFDDLAENRATRYFTLVLECIPFARRAEPTVVVAEPIPDVEPTWTTIDDCTSVTGWSSTGGAVSVVAGAIQSGFAGSPAKSTEVTRTGLSAAVAAGEFVAVDLECTVQVGTPAFYANGSAARVAAVENLAIARSRWYLRISPGTLAELVISVSPFVNPAGQSIYVHDVSKVDQMPFTGSGLQRSFTAEIGGTARTQADLVVEGEGGADIGTDLMVYTAAVGAAMDPPLRKWLESSSTSVPDVDAISGARAPFSSAPSEFVFPIPQPGTHLLMGRLRATSGAPTATLTWTASNATATYATASDVAQGSITVPLTASWQLYEIAMLTLPTIAVPPESPTTQRLSLQADAGAAVWDELWLFNISKGVGVLSWFADLHGSVAYPSRAVARSASLDSPRPAWLVGQAGDPSKDVDVSRRMRSPGEHEFAPGLIGVTAISTSAKVRVTFSAYPRFMHHVTKPAA